MWAKAERYADLRIVDKNEAGKINGFQFDVLTTPEGRGYIYIYLSISLYKRVDVQVRVQCELCNACGCMD
jgi:hypothetical protein